MMTLALLLKATAVLSAGLAAAHLARHSRASVRHLLIAASFVMLLLLPIANAISPSLNVPVPAALQTTLAPLAEDVAIDVVAATAGSVASNPAPPRQAPRPWNLPSVWQVLSFIWIAGTLASCLRIIVGIWQVRTLRETGMPWPPGEEIVATLRREAGARRAVAVLLHERVHGPMTCGILRPAIILPADAGTWTGADLDRALIHELEHVRRLDWLTQCIARIVSAVYWFHPVVWMAWRRFALEAERACDDAVLCHPRGGATAVDETAYADQLVHLAQRLSSGSGHIQLAMASRKDLSARITAVLDARQQRGRAGHQAVIGAALMAATGIAIISPLQLVAGTLASQTGAAGERPRFEIASVKPCVDEPAPPSGNGRQGGAGAGQTVSPDRLTLSCLTVEQLISSAYVIYGEALVNNFPSTSADGRYQWIKGLPAWATKEKFTIEAKAASPTDAKILRGPMLAALLEDRFQLKLHRDTDQAPVYALTVSRSGLKIRPEPCVPLTETAPPADSAYTERVLKGGQPNCGTFTMALGTAPGTRRWVLGGETMAKFAGVLSGALDRRVVDRTGLTDEYTIRLEFFPDEHNRGRSVADAGGNVPPDATGPNMFAAVEAQLGLKLEPVNAARGLVVVDSIERPKPDREVAASQVDAGIPLAEDTSQQMASGTQRFEAATIKPCTNEEDLQPGRARGTAGGTNAAISPGRFTVPCVTLEQLIYLAYASYGAREDERLANDYMGSASDNSKVRGGPEWVHSHRDKWAIEATAPGVSDRYVLMGAMLRTLLEERFRLKTHRETETVPMYALRLAKGGFKPAPLKDGDCDDSPKQPGPPQIVPGGKQPCGFITQGSADGTTRFHMVGFQVGMLTRRLADVMHMHVIDETGLTGTFVIDLQFASEDAPAGASAAPSVFTALEQQLGLKLEKTKGAAGFIVVDAAERPRPALARAAGAGR